eukprot:2818085-Prorocentrum_lima.AAC.1
MTSSLVGSEMCIRDRDNTLHSPTGSTDSGCLQATLENHDTRSRLQAWVAVSYTHLTLPTICSV